MNLWTLKICRIFHLISKVKYDEKRQIEIVKASPLFDAKWYLEQNPDVKAKKISAARHYVKWGWKEGRNPSKEFDTEAYLEQYPELLEKNWCPLFHYMLAHKELMQKANTKIKEKKTKTKKTTESTDYKLIAKSKYFDKRWYLKMYPDVKKAGVDPVKHYLQFGWKEGRNPSKEFSTNDYLNLNDDVKRAKINPLLHYEKYGKKEGRHFSTKKIKIYYNISWLLLMLFNNFIKCCQFKAISHQFINKSIDEIFAKISKYPRFEIKSNPLVSIIIPVYNQYKYTIACLYFIKKYTTDIDYEIILIDDNSSDETQNMLEKKFNITILHNKKNCGFLQNCHKGVKKAKGKYIVLLNNDILVTKNWLKHLLHVFNTKTSVGAVGGQTIFPNGLIQESGRYILNNGTSINKYKNILFEQFHGCLEKVHYCSGCLLLFKKSIWNKVGGFDTRFSPAYYEDTDFCMTLREKLHLHIYCEPKCKVIHFHNVSYNSSSNDLSDINRNKFIKKWKNELEKEEYRIKLSSDEINLITSSDYFDEEFYKNTYKISTDCIQHYFNIGWKIGYNPSRRFDTSYYLTQNFDVVKNGINPLLHFLKSGYQEGRSPLPYALNKNFLPFVDYLNKLQQVKAPKILFITHSYSLTGAPLAVFRTAIYFKKQGWDVTVVGFDNKELINDYTIHDIKVFHGKKYYFAQEGLAESLKVFNFIFVNTVLAYKWIRILPNDAYLWRISEGQEIFSQYKDPLLFETLKMSKNIYAVSDYTRKILQPLNKKVKLLLYGIEEQSQFTSNQDIDNIIRYLIIGNYCKRKGQDIVLKAIPLLKAKGIQNFEFIFMGSGFSNKKDEKYIKFIGVKKDLEKYSIIQNCDILLCPSLDDPNPQVVMEGMMMHKPCIVSDQTGQKDIITHASNGWIVKAGDVSSLVKTILQIQSSGKDVLKSIGEKSYQLYKQFFTQNNYLEQVKHIIEKESFYAGKSGRNINKK